MDWLIYFVLIVLLIFGWLVNAAGLPGLWIMVAASAVYGLITRWSYLGFKTMFALILIALIAEVVETIAGGAGAKRAGASKRGIIGAIIGGIVGGIVLSFFVPIIGTIVGACAGSLLGAVIVELSIGREVGHSFRIGVAAAKGRLLGIISKLAIGLLMLLIALYSALPIGARPIPIVPLTTPMPATTSVS
jgi:uncharacterized protein YqgC (DUF456 family)